MSCHILHQESQLKDSTFRCPYVCIRWFKYRHHWHRNPTLSTVLHTQETSGSKTPLSLLIPSKGENNKKEKEKSGLWNWQHQPDTLTSEHERKAKVWAPLELPSSPLRHRAESTVSCLSTAVQSWSSTCLEASRTQVGAGGLRSAFSDHIWEGADKSHMRQAIGVRSLGLISANHRIFGNRPERTSGRLHAGPWILFHAYTHLGSLMFWLFLFLFNLAKLSLLQMPFNQR